jgi:hypothetical protein
MKRIRLPTQFTIDLAIEPSIPSSATRVLGTREGTDPLVRIEYECYKQRQPAFAMAQQVGSDFTSFY